MTFATSFLQRTYTGKNGELTKYEASKFGTSGKLCLARLNKVSENGLAITFCDIASTNFESVVSESGAKKGIQPVKVEAGKPLLIDLNVAYLKDGKVVEEIQLYETVVSMIRGKEVKDGEIFFLSADFMTIPPKGWSKKDIKNRLADKDFEDNPFYIRRFENVLKTEAAEGVDSFESIIEEFGYDLENWKQAYEKIDGSKFVEKQAFQKKEFGVALSERVAALSKIEEPLKTEILTLIGCDISDKAQVSTNWEMLCLEWLKTV